MPILLLSGYALRIPNELKQMVRCHLMKGDPPGGLIEALNEVTGTTVEQRKSILRSKSSSALRNSKNVKSAEPPTLLPLSLLHDYAPRNQVPQSSRRSCRPDPQNNGVLFFFFALPFVNFGSLFAMTFTGVLL